MHNVVRIKPWYMYNVVSNAIQRYIESGLYRYHEEEAKTIVLGAVTWRRNLDTAAYDVPLGKMDDFRLMFIIYIVGNL